MSNFSSKSRLSNSQYKRLKSLAKYAYGKVLDIGFADNPNPFLSGDISGFDIQSVACPENYSEVITGDFLKNMIPSATFDSIIAGEVIEHLKDPVSFLSECNRLLKPTGNLVISTINPYYPPIILLNWFMIRKFYYSKDHKFEIAPRFMLRFLENAGFEAIKTVSLGMYLPLGKNKSVYIPSFRALCYQIMYIAKKK